MNARKLLWATTLLAASAMAAQPVDINTATAEEIAEALDGVGMSKAAAIVDYRKANGPFSHADQLVNVKGIGLRTVDLNRQFIVIKGSEKKTGS